MKKNVSKSTVNEFMAADNSHEFILNLCFSHLHCSSQTPVAQHHTSVRINNNKYYVV